MSVYKRKDSWYVYIKIKGQRLRKAIPEARTKYQAQQAETKIRNQIFEGKYGTVQSSKTFKEFAEKVYTPWTKENKKSWRNDVSRLKPLLEHFGRTRLVDITPFLIEGYKSKRSKTFTKRKAPRSKTTINREVQLLSGILAMAKTNREIATNPCYEVKKYKGEAKRTRYLSPDEEARLMAVIDDSRTPLKLILQIALQTGMREGEILRLKRQDIDLYKNQIHVRHTKTDKDREVPINSLLRPLIVEHLATLVSDYLFFNARKGQPILSIQSAFERAREAAGLEDFRFHDTRHTAATRMGEAGADVFAIAAVLGHQDIKTTGRYAHATTASKRAAVEALGKSGPHKEPQGHEEVRLALAK